jgi:glycosyltransferase involved in cell wall biosynthesis
MNRDRRLRVLMSAYACEPNRGSEPAVGWNWALQAAKDHEVWVLTRSNNRGVIENELAGSPVKHLQFIYHDLPRWARWLKKRFGLGTQLYYLVWQLTAWRAAVAVHRQERFDLAHHVTFVSFLFPSPLYRLGVPFIWGPLAGADVPPRSFERNYGLRGAAAELTRKVGIWAMSRNPLTVKTARKARLLISVTDQTDAVLKRIAPASNRRIAPAIGVDGVGGRAAQSEGQLRILFVGGLLPLKGVHLALRALRELLDRGVDATFTLVGDGPDRGRLKRQIKALKLGSFVRFKGRLSSEDVQRSYAEASIFLFPSLRDSGGMAVLEAMAAGLPVICLDIAGPALTVNDDCGAKIPVESPNQVVRDLADALERLAADPDLRRQKGIAARRRVEQCYTWDRKREVIRELYASVHAERGLAS